MDSVYGNTAKRRKTTAEKKEAAARRATALEDAQQHPPDAPYELLVKQPWAEKEVQVRFGRDPCRMRSCWLHGAGSRLWELGLAQHRERRKHL